MEYIAAYDFGTSGVKTALIGRDGSIAAVKGATYPLLHLDGLRVEQRPEDYWSAICETTRACLAEAGIAPEEVKGLSFSVQAVTIIPVAKNGETLGNAISWLDGRAEKQAQQINRRCGAELVRSQDHAPRLLWLKQNEPERYQKTEKFLECNSYLQFRATGVMDVGPTHPGLMQTEPGADVQAIYADIEPEKLAGTVEACCRFAALDRKGAEELGLAEGTPVFGGMIDVPAAAAGCGCTRPGDAHVYLGSSGWLSVLTDRLYDCSPGAYQLRSIFPGVNIYGGCTNCACLMQDWAARQLYAHERETLGAGFYPWLETQLDGVEAGCQDLYAAPWLSGEQFPLTDPHLRAMFFNISEKHTRADMMQAVRESICFSMRGQMELYTKDTGGQVREIGCNGGGALSQSWMQMLADVCQVPVRIPAHATYSGAIGAAFAAAVGLGWYTQEQVGEFVHMEKEFYPRRELSGLYERKYRNWMKLYGAVRDIYSELHGGI